jgi:hypothetical protein
MIPGRDSRKAKSPDAELDALVAREVDALTHRQARPASKPQAARDETEPNRAMHEPGPPNDAIELAAHRPNDGERPGRARSRADNVIGIRHGSLPSAGVLVFSAEEEAFIEGAVAFLRERPNADVIIEEVWTHAVLDRDDSADENLEQDAPEIDQISAADDSEQIPELEAGDLEAPPIEEERAPPVEQPAARPRGRNAIRSAPADDPAAKPPVPPPATSRGKQKRNGGDSEKDGDA